MPPELPLQLSVVLLGLGLGYLARGLSGFGSAMVALPILTLAWPLQVAVPAVVALDYLSSLYLSFGRWATPPARGEVWRLLPWGALGAVAGMLLLREGDNASLLLALGGLVIVFGGLQGVGYGRIPVSRRLAPLAGLTGGASGALFGVSAPPYILYLSSRLEGKSELRATFSYLALFDGGLRLLLLLLGGLLLAGPVPGLILLGLPCMALGLHLGVRLHHYLPEWVIRRVGGLLLAGLGCSLMYRGWVEMHA